jgi:hypothetical protein
MEQNGGKLLQPVGRHGEECRLVGRRQADLGDAAPDRGPDAELFPQPAGGQHDAEFEHPIEFDLGEFGGGTDETIALVEHTVDAVDQRFSASQSTWSAPPKLCTTWASDRLAAALWAFSARA